jgi:hypothetical protein
MTKELNVAIFVVLLAGLVSFAQESPTASPSPSASAASTRNVRISFLPPPLEGTISLGVYDKSGQLMRVLHQEAEVDEFTVGADALVTKWDGKNDDGEDLPAGKYHARGFVAAPMKIEEVGKTAEPMFIDPPAFVAVKLIPNPLENKSRPVINVTVSLDDENVFLKTTDGLPFLTIAQTTDRMHTDAALTQGADKSLNVFISEGAMTREFHITGADKMMAFDCGAFDLE